MSKWLDKYTVKLTCKLPDNWDYKYERLNIPGREKAIADVYRTRNEDKITTVTETYRKIEVKKWKYLVDFGCNLYNTVQEVKDIIDKSYPQDRELDDRWYVMTNIRRGEHFIEDVMFKIIKTLIRAKKKVETDYVPECVESRMYYIFKAHGEDPVLW